MRILHSPLLLFAAFVCAGSVVGAAQPNIILILADDLGYGDLGSYGQKYFATPSLDRLAAEGARLTHHYCAAPVCAPSRASLLLGVHQGHANVRDNQFDKALEDNHTLATVLRGAGYATAVIGKWGLHGQLVGGGATGADPHASAHPLNRGFDYFYGLLRHIDGHEHYPKEAPYFAGKAKTRGPVKVWDNRTDVTSDLDRCYTADLFTARAKKFILDRTAAAPQQPFFIYLAYDTPHAVLELPTAAYPAGGGLEGGIQWLGQPGRMINTATGTIDSWTYPEFLTPGSDRPWPDVYRRYATSVRRIDDCVADLVRLLADLGLDDNTLLVFTSDNGPEAESMLAEPFTPEFFRSYGPFDGLKRDLWEGGLRVPTIARWPKRIPAGIVATQPSAQWDWLPTFADAAGVPAPARCDGVSLLPALTGQRPLPQDRQFYFEYNVVGRTPAYAAFEPKRRDRLRNQMQAMRWGEFLGVRYDIKSADDDFEIYDVVADPKEIRNLALDPAFAARQQTFKASVLQSRRPDSTSPRPYENTIIPAAVGAVLVAGVEWRAYSGPFAWVPDFATLSPVAGGACARPDPACTGQKGAVGLCFTGYIVAPATGDYTLYLAADTGAVLRLHQATLIDADFRYAGGTEKADTVRLQAGPHPFQLSSIHAEIGMAKLTLEWRGPASARQPITNTAFAQAPFSR